MKRETLLAKLHSQNQVDRPMRPDESGETGIYLIRFERGPLVLDEVLEGRSFVATGRNRHHVSIMPFLWGCFPIRRPAFILGQVCVQRHGCKIVQNTYPAICSPSIPFLHLMHKKRKNHRYERKFRLIAQKYLLYLPFPHAL